MTDSRAIVDYELSRTGRMGYTIFFGVSVAGVAFLAYTLWGLLRHGAAAGLGAIGWVLVLLMLLFAATAVGLVVISGVRAFGPGLRISLTREGFKYQGLFSVVRVRWNEVASHRMVKGAFFDRLFVTLKPDARAASGKLTLDVSNLSPPLEDVLHAFAELTGQEADKQ
jgi:hypothetical protein